MISRKKKLFKRINKAKEIEFCPKAKTKICPIFMWQPARTELHIGAARYQESVQYVISVLNVESIKILHNTVLLLFLLLVRC